jgi:hypothetical protein
VIPRLQRWAAEQWPPALVALVLWCACAPLALPARGAGAAPDTSAAAAEWPTEWRGQPLQPLAVSAVEQRFAARFPGRIARFALGEPGRELVLRDVQRPTRLLHPAEDCWRGLGWRLQPARLELDTEQALWRCFEATRDGARVRVCERIVDAHGGVFTDTSAWFWAAALGRSSGPWRAVTRVQAL